MALVLGTNVGFVTIAPTGDPTGQFTTVIDFKAWALKDVAPAGATKITEIGWYCQNATQESNFEVAIYSHDSGNDRPNIILTSDTTNAKGTDAGWKRVTGLDISITAETIYWICAQLDNTTTSTTTDIQNAAHRYATQVNKASLPTPWGAGSIFSTRYIAIYAVYEAAPSVTNPKVKVSGTFSTKTIKTKISGTFTEKPLMVKVGGAFQ